MGVSEPKLPRGAGRSFEGRPTGGKDLYGSPTMVLGTLRREECSRAEDAGCFSWEAFLTVRAGSLWPWSDDFSGEPRTREQPHLGTVAVLSRSARLQRRAQEKRRQPVSDAVPPMPELPRSGWRQRDHRAPENQRASFHLRGDGGHSEGPAGHCRTQWNCRTQGPRLLGLSTGHGATRRRSEKRPSV